MADLEERIRCHERPQVGLPGSSDFRPFRQFEGVFYGYAKIANGALDLNVSKQNLTARKLPVAL